MNSENINNVNFEEENENKLKEESLFNKNSIVKEEIKKHSEIRNKIKRINSSEDEIIKIDEDKFQLHLSADTLIFEGKLNVITTLQNKIYEPSKYKPEEVLKTRNEQGKIEFKEIPLENYIRWKYCDNEKNETETNAKIIEWSDGTYQLVIGDQYIDLMFSNMENVRYGYNVGNNMAIIGDNIIKRILINQEKLKNLHKKNKEDDTTKIQLSYNYFDKTTFRKEDYGSKYSRRRTLNKEFKEFYNLGKKRKRNENE